MWVNFFTFAPIITIFFYIAIVIFILWYLIRFLRLQKEMINVLKTISDKLDKPQKLD